MKIVITGAGRGGLSLAVHLQGAGHEVTIIDRDAGITGHAAEQYGLVAMVGDATSSEILRQAEPQRADAVLAMLHRDADNLAVAMLARSLGARRVMVRMRDPDYRGLYASAGVAQILSETEILVGAMATAVEFEAVSHSMILGAGAAIAVEIEVLPGAWVIGRPVSEVAAHAAFPPSCVVAGMTLDGNVQAPRGAAVIEAGMQLLVVAARRDLRATIEFFRRTHDRHA
ncbi:MAG: Trk system potassium uptake protein TrkA [Labilithrix sp.]|nr:Trk system potassium uptake protein TrkA [Labilithrix sp.]